MTISTKRTNWSHGCLASKEAELKAAKVRIYFDNHAPSKSVRKAFLLMDMLSIEHKSKEIPLQDQFT